MTGRIGSQSVIGNAETFFVRRLILVLSGIIAAVIVVLPPVAAAQRQTATGGHWSSTFTFEDAPPAPKRRKLTDVSPFTDYEISVGRDAHGKLTATFSVNGTQVFESYECAVKENGGRIEFYYERFVADGATDQRKFKPGVQLFSLMEVKVGRETKYLFEPAAFEIVYLNRSQRKQSIYFTKQF